MISINTIIKTNDLSFYNEFGILTLNAKQFDTGRKFIFNIMENDEAFDIRGCKTYIRIQKADGTQFQGDACCKIEGINSIVVDTSIGNGNQILAAPGVNQCELHLEGNNGICLTTWTFNIYVEKRVHNAENLSSYNSFDVIDNMIVMEKDRIENEKIREQNEKRRILHENQRIDNEAQRKAEEKIRQDNENDRKNTFNTVLSQAQIYATSASVSAYNAKEAESWARGHTGIRQDENTNNSEFWCKQSQLHKNAAETLLNDATELLQDTRQQIIDFEFEVTDDGELLYESDTYDFEISDDGELEYWIQQEEEI